MAIYKVFPEKDATIYSEYPLKNTGLDEILEVSSKYDPTNPQVSRALIKFNTEEIMTAYSSFNNTFYPGVSYDVSFELYGANFSGLDQDVTVKILPISESWDMGFGRYANEPETTNGVSWLYRQASGSSPWAITGSTWHTTTNLTSSPDITSSQDFTYYSNTQDISVDVRDIFVNWQQRYLNQTTNGDPSGFVNEGFLIKLDNQYEFNTSSIKDISLKFFSRDTHTIYPPALVFKFADATFNTSSTIPFIDTSNMVVTMNPNSNEYIQGSGGRIKFRFNCRPQYPTRTFQTSSWYASNYYLPTSSYYAIKDLDTNEYVIDFDTTFTQISADSESSYFPLHIDWMQPERYYKVLVKTVINGETLILDNDYYFKIVNG